ncbi:hypothetical protein EVAR_38771_1 [Eumeta japonica]|uniref:Uncharacterized protein n=1 Tax=Eumeta variegata TaxID=151549 RepID=A0A4C1WMN2_EUMVA|nr:hypothetical protein EVAR_38771_1 [Eumeta japonica]
MPPVTDLSSHRACAGGLRPDYSTTHGTLPLRIACGNDVMRRFKSLRPFLLPSRVPILRHRDAFVTNFTAADFRALYRTGEDLPECWKTTEIIEYAFSRRQRTVIPIILEVQMVEVMNSFPIY